MAPPMSDNDSEDIVVTPRDRVVMLDGGVVLHGGELLRGECHGLADSSFPTATPTMGGNAGTPGRRLLSSKAETMVVVGWFCFICGGALRLA